MSDVEKAISGEDGVKPTTKSSTKTKTKTTTTNESNSLLTPTTKDNEDKQLSSSDQTERNWKENCISLFLKIVFSTPGLVVLVIGYSVLGALIFPLLEAPQDITKSAAIAKSREDCLRELWIITEKLNVLYERNWTMLVHEQLRRFEGSIVAATRQAGASTLANSQTALGHFGGGYDAAGVEHWSFSEALLYSVTVITTIGHGSLTPKTAAGKIATIFYALIGVPLMLMCLSSLGALLADALQCTYARLCCQLQRTMGARDGRGINKRRCSVDSSDNNEQQHSGNGMNCKNRKYDAINSETSLNDDYDYGSKRKLSLDHGEDRCQLLRNSSPAKLNRQNSPCMQAKAHPPHQQQQQPDVMLMTKAAAMQQKFDCSRSATPSPQHFQNQQHQFQQQGHQPQPVSQQAHALPTIHYVAAATMQPVNQQQQSTTLPRVQHHPHAQYQQQPQQHFVAVPSSILRFSLANQTTAGGTPTPPNCYPPPTASNTATIYFPISAATAAAASVGVSGSSNPMTSTGSGGMAGTAHSTYCQQPLIKYHTIQLQPTATKRMLVAPIDATSTSAATAAVGAHTTTMAPNEGMTTSTSILDAMTLPPLPPPPAYQTATVHGVRRAKFLTKPLTHEINTLMTTECGNNGSGSAQGVDIVDASTSCRHDLLHNTTATTTTTSTTTSAAAAAANNTLSPAMKATGSTGAASMPTMTMPTDNNLIAAGVCGPAAMSFSSTTTAMATAATTATTTTAGHTKSMLHGGGSAVGGGGYPETVDIMEDEDEHEQQRLSNCPHGTPSRVPLIAAASPKSCLSSAASSFHRHTLHPTAGNRKTLLLTRRGCQMHTHYDSAATTETSDCDDDGEGEYMQHGSEQFVLKKLKRNGNSRKTLNRRHRSGSETEAEQHIGDGDDDADDDMNGDSDGDGDGDGDSLTRTSFGTQVPISIVLLILICYICVGTVIFAFWENWSLIDGAYFCFVTLSTIGYGDFVPTRTFQGPEVQLYACCAYLLLGLVLVAMSFSILETQLMWKCKRIAVRLKLAKV